MSAKGTDNRLTGDEESLWDDNKWEEIEDIVDEEIQEVDNVTYTGGVRG
jgi:hypothetical protein